jgi:hypothetical protein
MILGPHQSILGLINEDPYQLSRPKSLIKPELTCYGAWAVYLEKGQIRNLYI